MAGDTEGPRVKPDIPKGHENDALADSASASKLVRVNARIVSYPC